jgi:glycosyltransferase involved in cell wall biosynthesis
VAAQETFGFSLWHSLAQQVHCLGHETPIIKRGTVTTIRVCLVTEIFHPEDQGGQGRQAFALARRMNALGAGVSVVTRQNYPDSNRQDLLDGVSITRLPPNGLFKGKGWRAVTPTLRFLSGLFFHLWRTRRDYDVLLVQGVKATLLPTALLASMCRKRWVVKIDAIAEFEQELTPESIASMGLSAGSRIVRWWAQLRDALLSRANAIIAISGEIEVALIRRLGLSIKVARIPNGLDFRTAEATANKRELRDQLELPQRTLVTYTGRLSRAKGLPMLLETWRQICTSHADAHLVIVGGGDRSFDNCEAELRAYVRDSGLQDRVTFTGHVSDVTNHLRASDLFVLCSETEGFGLSLLEAMAEGLPCICTEVGVAPEIIQHGESGWLIPVRDPAAARAALTEALASMPRWAAMGATARAAVVARFDMDRVAAAYLYILTALPARRRSLVTILDRSQLYPERSARPPGLGD